MSPIETSPKQVNYHHFNPSILGGSSPLVINHHGDRFRPLSWGCGTPSTWPFYGLLIRSTTYNRVLGPILLPDLAKKPSKQGKGTMLTLSQPAITNLQSIWPNGSSYFTNREKSLKFSGSHFPVSAKSARAQVV